MSWGRVLAAVFLTAGSVVTPPVVLRASEDTNPALNFGEELFRAHCSICHSLKLAQSQQLDRANWEWVVDDMVTEFGASWIGPTERTILLDYLVEHYGPGK